MNHIISVENIKIEPSAIYTIAKHAQGGMRDALSLLDQALSYSGDFITEANVHDILGTISEEHLINIVSRLVNHDTTNVLKLLDDLISLGKEPLRLIENIIYYFRDLYLIQKMDVIDKQIITNHSEKTIALAKGISEKEVSSLEEHQFLPIGLGPRILRTETAPLYIMSAISYELELGEENES